MIVNIMHRNGDTANAQRLSSYYTQPIAREVRSHPACRWAKYYTLLILLLNLCRDLNNAVYDVLQW